jgi:hypothetical protein
MIDSNKIKEVEVNFKSNSMEKDKKIFEKTYREIIKKIDEQFRKGNNWITNLNSYFLYKFFGRENLISVLNFKIDTKLYKCQFINVANDIKAFENFYYFAVKK